VVNESINKGIQMNHPLKSLAAALLGLSCMAAHAAIDHYEFTAEVMWTDGSLLNVGEGTIFSGQIVADAAQPGLWISDAASLQYEVSGWVASYSLGPNSVMSADIGGHRIVGQNATLHVYDNMGGNVEDGISFDSGSNLTIDDTVWSGGAFGFNLTTVPGNTGVVLGLGLPESIDVAAFDGDKMSLTYGYLQGDGGEQRGTMLQFLVTSMNVVQGVPEPSTQWSMLLGLGAIGAVAFRRRQRAA
jgi:hypothetical protein